VVHRHRRDARAVAVRDQDPLRVQERRRRPERELLPQRRARHLERSQIAEVLAPQQRDEPVEPGAHDLAPDRVLLVAPHADDDVVALVELGHHQRDLGHPPLAVGADVKDDLPARCTDERALRDRVALVGLVLQRPQHRHLRGQLLQDGPGAIGRAVVAHQDLVAPRHTVEHRDRLRDRVRDDLLLVEGRDTDAHPDGFWLRSHCRCIVAAKS